jgi:hypothetical protein
VCVCAGKCVRVLDREGGACVRDLPCPDRPSGVVAHGPFVYVTVKHQVREVTCWGQEGMYIFCAPGGLGGSGVSSAGGTGAGMTGVRLQLSVVSVRRWLRVCGTKLFRLACPCGKGW